MKLGLWPWRQMGEPVRGDGRRRGRGAGRRGRSGFQNQLIEHLQLDEPGRCWWRVVSRYEGDAMWVPILRLAFVRENGAISLKEGFPQHRGTYRVIQRELKQRLGLQVSPARAQQLVNEALANAVLFF